MKTQQDSLTQYYLAMYILTQTPFDACNFSSLTVLSDIFCRYLTHLSTICRQCSEHGRRTLSMPLDLIGVLDGIGLDLDDLDGFYAYCERRQNGSVIRKLISQSFPSVSFMSTMSNGAVVVDGLSNGGMSQSGAFVDSERPAHIPSWLPAFPSNDNSASQSHHLIGKSAGKSVRLPLMRQPSRPEWNIKVGGNPYSHLDENPDQALAASIISALPIRKQEDKPQQSDDIEMDSHSVGDVDVEKTTFSGKYESLIRQIQDEKVKKLLKEQQRNEPLENFLPSSTRHALISSEPLVSKTTINYIENPLLLEFPVMKKTKWFMTPRVVMQSERVEQKPKDQPGAPGKDTVAYPSQSSNLNIPQVSYSTESPISAVSDLQSPVDHVMEDADMIDVVAESAQPAVVEVPSRTEIFEPSGDLSHDHSNISVVTDNIPASTEGESKEESSLVTSKAPLTISAPVVVTAPQPAVEDAKPKIKIRFSLGGSSAK